MVAVANTPALSFANQSIICINSSDATVQVEEEIENDGKLDIVSGDSIFESTASGSRDALQTSISNEDFCHFHRRLSEIQSPHQKKSVMATVTEYIGASVLLNSQSLMRMTKAFQSKNQRKTLKLQSRNLVEDVSGGSGGCFDVSIIFLNIQAFETKLLHRAKSERNKQRRSHPVDTVNADLLEPIF